jgi:dCMP deaminase
MGRISRDEYYMNIAVDVAQRSTCLRRQIGAVIVNGDVIISTGYNGNPRGMPHCEQIGCIRDELNIPSGERTEICTGVHAEMNTLIFAGKESRGGTLYTTIVPCSNCAKMIVNAGIQRVVYCEGYPDMIGLEMLQAAGILVDRVSLGGVRLQRDPGQSPVTPGPMKPMEEMQEALNRKLRLMKQLEAGEPINEVAARSLKERLTGARGKGAQEEQTL